MCDSSVWSIITAISTLLAVIVALFGDSLRNILFAPSLNISIFNPSGQYVEQTIYNIQNEKVGKQMARYYHLCVSNKKRKRSAIDSQVWITKIEEFIHNEITRTLWEDEIPMQWKDQVCRSNFLTIGPSELCDLCYISENKELIIRTLYEKGSFKTRWTEKCNLIISLHVKYKENKSETFRFKIFWDGQWVEGEKEMSQHFILHKIK